MSYRELYAEAAQRVAKNTIERLATCHAYQEASYRLKHMIAYDHDLDMVAKKTPAERLAILLDSIKDFNTFLENYIAECEAQAKKELENS